MKIPKTKKDMIEFLSNHFRYDTMNSWNRATSYARNVKLNHLSFPDKETMDRAWDLLDVEEAFDESNQIMREFDEAHDYKWQIGRNGRSGGYLVLYQGGRKPSEYKRICWNCFQKNYQKESVKCGKCGSDNMHDYAGFEAFTYPGKGLDIGEDFDEWDADRLRDRVKLVMEFDDCCEQCVEAFIAFCQTHTAKEDTIMVPKKIKVAEEITP